MAKMAKKVEAKYLALAYLSPPVIFLILFSIGIVPRNVFAFGMPILLAALVFMFFFPRLRAVERTRKIALPAVIAAAVIVAAGSFLGVNRGVVVFDEKIEPGANKTYNFQAKGPLEVDIEGAFDHEGQSNEKGSYHLVVKGGGKGHDIKGEFKREWFKVRKSRKARSGLVEDITGLASIQENGPTRDWELSVVKIDENIDNNFHIRIFQPLLADWISPLIAFLLAFAIIVLEFFQTKTIIAQTRFTEQMREEFPPATWLMLSSLLFLIIYPLASEGLHIELGFVVALPGAAVGGVIMCWIIQQAFYKKLEGKK